MHDISKIHTPEILAIRPWEIIDRKWNTFLCLPYLTSVHKSERKLNRWVCGFVMKMIKFVASQPLHIWTAGRQLTYTRQVTWKDVCDNRDISDEREECLFDSCLDVSHITAARDYRVFQLTHHQYHDTLSTVEIETLCTNSHADISVTSHHIRDRRLKFSMANWKNCHPSFDLLRKVIDHPNVVRSLSTIFQFATEKK